MTIKQERIQDLILTHLSEVLMFEVTDPAIQGITVMEVKLDREIQYADIYVHALGEEEREREVLDGLKRATGFLRSALAKRLRIRQMPILHFRWDKSLAAGDHIEEILNKLRQERGEEPLPKLEYEERPHD